MPPINKPKKPPKTSQEPTTNQELQDTNEPVCSSWTLDEGREMISLHGPFGAGKTTLLASASKFFPDELSKERYTGSKPKHVLEDMFIIAIDRGGLVGLRERGIMAPKVVSLPNLMGDEDIWRKAKFSAAPTPMQAMEYALNQAARSDATIVGVDTVSTFNKELDNYFTKHPFMSKRGNTDTMAKFGAMFHAHQALHYNLRLLPKMIIYSCHSKVVDPLDPNLTDSERGRLLTLTMAGMPSLILDITGQGAGVYKADSSLQLSVLSTTSALSKYPVRKCYTITREGWEGKNRRELSLNSEEPAHLRHILTKWRS